MLTLILKFSTPVAMGTGEAGRGLDHALDHDEPLSASGIKGVLRDEARWLLPGPKPAQEHALVQAVFGSATLPCPWNFTVTDITKPHYAIRSRIQIGSSGTVTPGALAVGEEAGIEEATIEVLPRGIPSNMGLSAGSNAQENHLALLNIAAHAAEKVGQQRTRGLGWMRMQTNRDVQSDLRLIWQLRQGDAA